MDVKVSFHKRVALRCTQCHLSMHYEYQVKRVEERRCSVKRLRLIGKLIAVGGIVPPTRLPVGGRSESRYS